MLLIDPNQPEGLMGDVWSDYVYLYGCSMASPVEIWK